MRPIRRNQLLESLIFGVGALSIALTLPIAASGFEPAAEEEALERLEQVKRHELWLIRQFGTKDLRDLHRRAAVIGSEEKRLERERAGRLPLSQAGSWSSLGPTFKPRQIPGQAGGDDSGLVSSIAVHPTDPGTIYVGTASAGVWKTADGGASWRLVTEDVGILQIGAVAVAPSAPQRVYAGTGCADASSYVLGPGWQYEAFPLRIGVGVLISDDAGASWRVSRTSPQNIFWDISVAPHDPNVVLTAGDQGVVASTDGGDSWFTVLRNENAVFATRLARSAASPDRVYAATWGPGKPGSVYRSEDGGATWAEKPLPGDPSQLARVQIAVSATNPNRVYALGATPDDKQAGMVRSDDGGDTWTVLDLEGQQVVILNQGNFANIVSVDPRNPDVVYAAGLDTWKSVDAGRSWRKISDWTGRELPYLHADHHAHAYGPDGTAFYGNDGGIFRSRDGGSSFEAINRGIGSFMISELCQDPQNPDRLMAGMQDNGPNLRVTGGEWKLFTTGDGFGCAFHATNPRILLGSVQTQAIYRSTDGGESWEDGSQGITEAGGNEASFRTLLLRHPTQPDTVVTFSSRNVWVSQDNAASWQLLSQTMPLIQPIKDLTLSTDGNRAVLLDAAGQVVETPDGGATWQKIGEAAGAGFQRIRIDPRTPTTLYVCTIDPNREKERLWMSADNGESWSAISRTGQPGGLPDLPIMTFEPDPTQAGVLWAGTFVGLYRSGDGGQSWERFGNGLPNVPVTTILFTNDGRVRVGTFGRGAWEASAAAGRSGSSSGTPGPLAANPPVPSFTFEPDDPQPERGVRFTDTSTGVVSSWAWSFGDGATAKVQHPYHVFLTAGSYSVTLTVTNSAGSRSVTKTVKVAEPPITAGYYIFLLPVVLTTSGAGGTSFTTELTLSNKVTRPLGLVFRTKGTFEGSASYRMKPGQEVYPDVFAFLKGIGMSVPSGTVVTSLRIELYDTENPGDFGAQVRVTTPPNDDQRRQGIGGRFGLAFPATPVGLGAERLAMVYGLQQTSSPGQAGTRSNLACVHAGAGSDGPIGLEVTYRDGLTGRDHPSKDTFTLTAFEFGQKTQPLAERGIKQGWAEIRRVSGDDQFVCYGVLNDNVNGDGSYVPMVPVDSYFETADAMIPVIVGTDTFRSELTLANRTSTKMTAEIALVPAAAPFPKWASIDVDAGKQVIIADLVAELRRRGTPLPAGSFVGALYVYFNEAINPLGPSVPSEPIDAVFAYAGVRTYASKAGGLFGLAYGYSPIGYAADVVAYVYGLQQTGTRGQEGGTRSNLALLHTLGGEEDELTLEVTYFAPDGRELGKEPKCNPCRLQPGQNLQFNTPLEANGYGVPHAYARVRRLAGSDQFLAYGVLNDQANDDGSYIFMSVP